MIRTPAQHQTDPAKAPGVMAYHTTKKARTPSVRELFDAWQLVCRTKTSVGERYPSEWEIWKAAIASRDQLETV